MGILEPGHLVIILAIALLVFGPKKLPELGKGLGESIRGFKNALASRDPDPDDPALPPPGDAGKGAR